MSRRLFDRSYSYYNDPTNVHISTRNDRTTIYKPAIHEPTNHIHIPTDNNEHDNNNDDYIDDDNNNNDNSGNNNNKRSMRIEPVESVPND